MTLESSRCQQGPELGFQLPPVCAESSEWLHVGHRSGCGLSNEWLCLTFGLRREALLVRVEVEDLCQPAVAAVGLKLGAAWSG